MGKKNILFVHEGKPVDKGANKIILMPMGLISLADFIESKSLKSHIIHLPTEKHLDPEFDIIKKIEELEADIICLDIHWHQQLYFVTNLIKKIKEEMPNKYIIVGGYTASYFYNELMNDFKEIDYIIRGDGEVPLKQLVNLLYDGNSEKELRKVPNLVWRKKSKPIINPLSFTHCEKSLGKLNHANFDLIVNKEHYIKPRIFEGVLKKPIKKEQTVFFYNCGRGCPYNCSICGGSKSSQRIISNRKKISYTPIPTVIENLKKAKSEGFDTWFNTFDPSLDRTYFNKLFKKIREENINLNLQFEQLHIPSEEFIKDTLATFENIRFDFVIKTGSDNLRKRNKGNFYNNYDIIETLKRLSRTRIKVDLSIAPGLPFESNKTILETLSLISYIKNNFKNVRINSEPLEIEPVSPMHMEHEKYNIIPFRKNFYDFLKAHSQESGLGYRTKEFTEEQILKIEDLFKLEAGCKMKKSFFHQYLLKNLFLLDYFHIDKLKNLCKPCKNYNKCMQKC